MFVRHVKDIIGTERDVQGNGWKSRRLILAGDGLKFSVHETIVDAGVVLNFNYEAHSETVYCVDGEGSIRNAISKETSELRAGSIYSAGIGDAHVLTAKTKMKLLCIFDPALTGGEEAN